MDDELKQLKAKIAELEAKLEALAPEPWMTTFSDSTWLGIEKFKEYPGYKFHSITSGTFADDRTTNVRHEHFVQGYCEQSPANRYKMVRLDTLVPKGEQKARFKYGPDEKGCWWLAKDESSGIKYMVQNQI